MRVSQQLFITHDYSTIRFREYGLRMHAADAPNFIRPKRSTTISAQVLIPYPITIVFLWYFVLEEDTAATVIICKCVSVDTKTAATV